MFFGISAKSRDEGDLFYSAIRLFVFFSPFLVGGYYEWSSCLLSVWLLCSLAIAMYKRGRIIVPKSCILFAAAVVAAAYGLSALWAIDRGMAILGMIKFLPLPLFAVVIAQVSSAQRRRLFSLIPLSGTVMTGTSAVLGLLPALHSFFYVNSRLAGFFQYPNTFALFLLAGVIIVLCDTKLAWKQTAILAVLFLGIALSGSRTVFAMLIIFGLFFITQIGKRERLIVCGIMLALLLCSALYAALTDNYASISRYLTTSLTSSTFLGRFLYYIDAIPIIAKHPLGLGYLGYYFTQGAFQTGVYSVVNVHNDLLQILLDIGWIPSGICVYAVIRRFCVKRHTRPDCFLIIAVCLHCLFDFDLQFPAVGFILIMALTVDDPALCSADKRFFIPAAIVCSLVCFYFGSASFLYYRNDCKSAVKLYPGYTLAWTQLLSAADNVSELNSTADRVIELNESVSLAYSAKAKASYANGDFGHVIEYKKKALQCAKYELDEYLDYFDMLYVGIRLYAEHNDAYSADVCRKTLFEIPEMLAEVTEQSSPLAWRINDQPNLVLPDEYMRKLTELKVGTT